MRYVHLFSFGASNGEENPEPHFCSGCKSSLFRLPLMLFLRRKVRGAGGGGVGEQTLYSSSSEKRHSVIAADSFSAVGETRWDHTVPRISCVRLLRLDFLQ